MARAETADPEGSKYLRVRDALLGHIANLHTHDPLPSERELANQYGISRMTARRVVESLTRDGYVYRRPGAGTYVATPTVSKALPLAGFSEDMRARGLSPGARIVHAETCPAGPRVGPRLDLSPRQLVTYLVRVRLADDVTMCLERTRLPDDLFPGLLDLTLGTSLYAQLHSTYGVQIRHASQTIRATVFTTEEAALLDVPPLSPALHVTRTGYDDSNRPAEFTESFYRADRYDFTFAIHRERG